MTIAPEHLSMALEWIDDLEVFSDDVEDDTSYFRIAPHLAFDLDSTLSEVIRSESEDI